MLNHNIIVRRGSYVNIILNKNKTKEHLNTCSGLIIAKLC